MSEPVNQKPAETESDRGPVAADATATTPATGGTPGATNGDAGVTNGPNPAEARVKTLEQEVSNLKDQLLRALAEVENIRRRAQREREDTAKFAISGFAKELLPVADNLRRALEALPAEARDGNDLLKTLVVGVEATERQLIGAFDRVGIRKMEPQGETFDPNFHQVMFEVENTGRAAGTVVQVLQAGYLLQGRLLREAMVGVAKRGAEDNAQQHIDTKA